MAGQESHSNLPLYPASDADRERAHEVIKQACLNGQLTLDELSRRVELVESALTRDQIVEATHDLWAAPSASVAAPATTLAIMSDVQRVGRWRVGERTRAIVVMGACKLDLTRAAISAPVTTIQARVLMGALDVIVPEGVEVELETTTIMGSRTIKGTGPPPPVGLPLIRITGLALMASVTVRYSR